MFAFVVVTLKMTCIIIVNGLYYRYNSYFVYLNINEYIYIYLIIYRCYINKESGCILVVFSIYFLRGVHTYAIFSADYDSQPNMYFKYNIQLCYNINKVKRRTHIDGRDGIFNDKYRE